MSQALQQTYIAVPSARTKGNVVLASFIDEKADMEIIANNMAAPYSPFNGEIMTPDGDNTTTLSIASVRKDLCRAATCATCENDLYILKATAAQLAKLEDDDAEPKLYCIMCDTKVPTDIDRDNLENEVNAAADDDDEDYDDEDDDSDDDDLDDDSDDDDDDDEDDDEDDDDDDDEDDDDDDDDEDLDDDEDDDEDDNDDDDTDEDDEDDNADGPYDDTVVEANANTPAETEDDEIAEVGNTEASSENTPTKPVAVEQTGNPVVVPADAEKVTINLSEGAPAPTVDNVSVACLSPVTAMLFIDGEPAYRLEASKAEDTAKDFFASPRRLSSLVATIIDTADGKVDFSSLGATPFTVDVNIKKEFNDRVTASVKDEREKIEAKSAELKEDLEQSLAIAALSIIKNLDGEHSNPIRDELVASLKKIGVKSTNVVDNALAKGCDAFVKNLFVEAKILMDKSVDARNEIGKMVSKASYQTTASLNGSSDSERAVETLSRGSLPFSGPVTAAAIPENSDDAFISNIQNLLRA